MVSRFFFSEYIYNISLNYFIVFFVLLFLLKFSVYVCLVFERVHCIRICVVFFFFVDVASCSRVVYKQINMSKSCCGRWACFIIYISSFMKWNAQTSIWWKLKYWSYEQILSQNKEYFWWELFIIIYSMCVTHLYLSD